MKHIDDYLTWINKSLFGVIVGWITITFIIVFFIVPPVSGYTLKIPIKSHIMFGIQIIIFTKVCVIDYINYVMDIEIKGEE